MGFFLFKFAIVLFTSPYKIGATLFDCQASVPSVYFNESIICLLPYSLLLMILELYSS